MAARVAIDYRSELRLTDREAVVSCRVEKVGGSSITVRSEIRSPEGRLAAECETVIVAWDPQTRGARPIADGERAVLEAVRG